MEDRRKLLYEEELNKHGMVNELKEITMFLKDINRRILVGIIVMVAIFISIAMK